MAKRLLIVLNLIAFSALGWGIYSVNNLTKAPSDQFSKQDGLELSSELQLSEKTYRVRSGSTVSQNLVRLGFSHRATDQMIKSARPLVNLGWVRAGTRFKVFSLPGPLNNMMGVRFLLSPIEQLDVVRDGDEFKAFKILKEIETRLVTFSGEVSSSLWESALEVQMDPQLIADLAEIFAWEVDFAREVRNRDRWRLTVEQELVDGKVIGWGSILAAEYVNAGEKYTAALFRDGNRDKGYFTPEGESLRRMFF